MDKWDAIENKVTEKKGSSKWVVILCVVAGVILACSGLVGIFIFVDVEGYLSETKEIVSLHDFYDLKVGETETAVYAIGASYVGFSVYPPAINRILAEEGYNNVSVYNTFVNGENPLSRVVHLQNLIDSKPSIVIVGISVPILDVSCEGLNVDNVRAIQAQNRLNLREDSLYLFTDSELKLLNSPNNPIDKKKYISSALYYKFVQQGRIYVIDYLTDPVGGENVRKEYWDNRVVEAHQEEVQSLKYGNYTIRYTLSKQNTAALHYIIDTLEKENISVILVNTPINPIKYNKISQDTLNEYFDILDDTGYEWYDLQPILSEEYFFDATHTKFAGAMQLAPIYADMIIQEVKSGAVHYT